MKMKLPVQQRMVAIEPHTRAEGESEDAPRRVPMLTDAAVERWWGIETLSFEEGAVDLSRSGRGIPMFLEHGGPWLGNPDPSLRVGRATDLKVEGNRLTVIEQFSRTARGQDAKLECDDDITPYRSGGYIPLKMKVTKKGDRNTGEKDQYLVTRWRPVEHSIVAFPADPKAVQPRSEAENGDAVQYEVEIEGETSRETSPPHVEEEIPMKKVRNEQGQVVEVNDDDPRPAIEVRSEAAPRPAGATPTPDASASTDPAEIVRLCEAHGMQARAAEFLEKKLTVGQVSREILTQRSSEVRPQPAAEALAAAASPKGPLKRFSYARAIRQRVLEMEGKGKYDGAEGEYDQEVRKNLPVKYLERGGHFMPIDRLSAEERMVRAEAAMRMVRGLGTGIPGGGAELVFDQVGEFIDILRNRSIIGLAGGQFLTGLTGPVVFPRQTADPTLTWMPENSSTDAPGSDLKFGTTTLSPHTLIGVVPFPRQLVNMAGVDIEGRVRNSLAAKHGLEVDRVALHGKGTDGEPLGLYDTTGVGSVAFGGAITYPKVVDMGGKVADANADTENMRYITTPLVASKAKQTLVASAAGSAMIWDGTFRDGMMAGYKAHATRQVRSNLGGGSDHGMAFGDWSEINTGLWGAFEFILDIVTLAGRGQIKITTFQMADVANLRPEAFCIATGLTA